MAELSLDALERRALEAWGSIEPPTDFVERVVPAAPPSLPSHPKPRRVPWFPMAAAAVAGLMGFAVFGIESDPPRDPSQARVEGGLTTLGGPEQGLVEPDAEEGPTWAAPALPADFGAHVERYVESYGEHYGPAFRFHGAIMVARDGEVLYARGFGRSDLTPPSAGGSDRINGPDTRFRIGSLTQQFTAVAILQLAEQGKLSIDDPVSKYLPELEGAYDQPLTLWHLLSHTSGLWNFTDDPMFVMWKRYPQDTASLIGRIGGNGVGFAPGSDFEASNSNYLILGRIVELVSGESYGDYLEEHVFEPAGMTKTRFGDAYDTGEQAQGYVFNEEEFLEPAQDIHLPTMGGAGAITSTPQDLARWHYALDEGDLLSAESTRLMYTPVRKNYGLGWVTSRLFGRTVVSHPGGVDGFNAHLMRFIDDRTMVLAISNSEVIDCRRIANDVAAIVYGHEPEPRTEHQDIYMDPAVFHRYEGKYELTSKTRHQYSKVIEKEQLDRMAEVHVDRDDDRLWLRVPGHGSKWMHPLGEDRFFFKDDAGTTAKFVGDESAEWLVIERQGREFLLRRSR